MIYVECSDCRHWSHQGCRDCAEDHAARHTADTGHENVRIHGRSEPIISWQTVAEWMKRK